MNLYVSIGAGLGTGEAASLSQRLVAWHDAMVAHERRQRAGRTGDACSENCAHAEARALWAEAVTTFGARAHELSFLRSRATGELRTSEDGSAEESAAIGDSRSNSRPEQMPGGRRRSSFLRTSVGKTTAESPTGLAR